jgi:hypothetical protein
MISGSLPSTGSLKNTSAFSQRSLSPLLDFFFHLIPADDRLNRLIVDHGVCHMPEIDEIDAAYEYSRRQAA